MGERVFRQLGFRRIQASALSINEQAIAIYKKWLVEEGCRIGILVYNNKLVNRHLYGLLKEDSMWAKGGKYENGIANDG